MGNLDSGAGAGKSIDQDKLVLRDSLWAGAGREESQTSGFKLKGPSMHDR